MKIGLVDVDRNKFPNLALMKISAWHKSQGDNVEWANPLFAACYDRVYKSKIFTFSQDDTTPYDCEVVKGGTGYSLTTELPKEIDLCQPDYSIYPQIDKKQHTDFLLVVARISVNGVLCRLKRVTFALIVKWKKLLLMAELTLF